MSKIVYCYWNVRGIAEPCRLLLHYSQVDFEDKRYSVSPVFDVTSWRNEKFNLGLDFPNLPYLIDGDVKITQSISILRYLARKYKLIGEIESDTIRIEMGEQQFLDLRIGFENLCFSSDYEKQKDDYLKTLPEKLGLISKFLGNREFVVGSKLTYVDFLLYEVLDFHRLFNVSSLDAYENLKSFMERFESLPTLEKYMQSKAYLRLPICGRFQF